MVKIRDALDFVDSPGGRWVSVVAAYAALAMLVTDMALALATFANRTWTVPTMVAAVVPTAMLQLWNFAIMLRHGEQYGRASWGIRSRAFPEALPFTVRLALTAIAVAGLAISFTAWLSGPPGHGYYSVGNFYYLESGQYRTKVSYSVYQHAVAMDQAWHLGALASSLAWALLAILFHLRLTAVRRTVSEEPDVR